MPRGDPCWTQPEYINFALWVDGSSFTVGEVDSIPIVQFQRKSIMLQDPEPSQPSLLYTDMTSEPTTDGEPEPAMMKVPELRTAHLGLLNHHVVLSHQLSVSTWVSTSIGAVSVSHPHGFIGQDTTMASPSLCCGPPSWLYSGSLLGYSS